VPDRASTLLFRRVVFSYALLAALIPHLVDAGIMPFFDSSIVAVTITLRLTAGFNEVEDGGHLVGGADNELVHGWGNK
jgi:hypothetical protein